MGLDHSDIRIHAMGTHHKCGTLWMRAVFKEMAATLGHDFKRGNNMRQFRDMYPDVRTIACSWNSAFPDAFLERDDVRVMHLIRDPRDVLLSGARYHENFEGPREDFLHIEREELGGLTYQQALRALPTPEDKLLFEMRGKHATTLAAMAAWSYGRENVIEVRYEDLIVDTEAELFGRILTFLGLTADEIAVGQRIFVKNSLFGDLGAEVPDHDRLSEHVYSGAPRQWHDKMPISVAEAYVAEFGDDLIKSGYETDHTWLSALKAARANVAPAERARQAAISPRHESIVH